jgi:hypothetical protein
MPDILAEQEGLQPGLGGLESPDGMLAGAREVAARLVLDRRPIDWCQSAGAREPGQLGGIASIGCDAVAGFLWAACGGHAPAAQVLPSHIAIAPRPAGSSLIDQDERFGLRGEGADRLIEVTLAGAAGAQEDHLGTPLFRGIRHGDGLVVDIQTNVQGATVTHG